MVQRIVEDHTINTVVLDQFYRLQLRRLIFSRIVNHYVQLKKVGDGMSCQLIGDCIWHACMESAGII